MSGSQKIIADPERSATRPINQDVNDTITATNACGGSITKTAKWHIVGCIHSPPRHSCQPPLPTAYPTAPPTPRWVASEKMNLDNLATQFKTLACMSTTLALW